MSVSNCGRIAGGGAGKRGMTVERGVGRSSGTRPSSLTSVKGIASIFTGGSGFFPRAL
jgi:hypothetical protein